MAKVIDLMASSNPGVEYSAVHYKYLEQHKTNGKENYDPDAASRKKIN